MAQGVLHRPRKPQRGILAGYDCEFVQHPTSGQTECSICLQVLRSPHLASCCGHNFCKECIEHILEGGKSCPLCNRDGFTVIYNREKDVALKQLKVNCTHRKIGCDWTGVLERLEEHLNVDPKIEKQLEGCGFVEVECFNDDCGQVLKRHLLNEHQFKKCQHRHFSCEYCHEYESTYSDVSSNHWLTCPYYPVPCPNKCTQMEMERQHLQKHLNKDCPLQAVDCEFKYAGCEAKLPRKDMLEHLNKNVGHMTLLARQNQELTAKLLAKEEMIRKMTEEIKRLMEKNRKEVERNVRKMEEARRELEELSLNHQEKLQRKEEQIEVLVKQYYSDIERLEREKTEKINSLTQEMKLHMEKQYPTKRDLELRVAGLKQQRDTTRKDLEKEVGSLRRALAQVTTKRDLETRVERLERKLDTTKRDLQEQVGGLAQKTRSNPRSRRARGGSRSKRDSQPHHGGRHHVCSDEDDDHVTGHRSAYDDPWFD